MGVPMMKTNLFVGLALLLSAGAFLWIAPNRNNAPSLVFQETSLCYSAFPALLAYYAKNGQFPAAGDGWGAMKAYLHEENFVDSPLRLKVATGRLAAYSASKNCDDFFLKVTDKSIAIEISVIKTKHLPNFERYNRIHDLSNDVQVLVQHLFSEYKATTRVPKSLSPIDDKIVRLLADKHGPFTYIPTYHHKGGFCLFFYKTARNPALVNEFTNRDECALFYAFGFDADHSFVAFRE